MKFLASIFNLLRFNKKNWKAVVLCIFAATVFWFFNALNKSYSANINFPLAFDYSHEDYVPVKPLPNKVRINVTGIGWNLFRRSSGIKIPPLSIPLERPVEVKKIVGSALPGFFANQLEGLEINFVVTDTLYLDLQPKAGRWLKITVDSVQRNIRKQYSIVSNIDIEPDSVFVEGPLTMVTNLKEPIPLKIPEQNIDERFYQDVEVVLLNGELIQRNPPTVLVSFNVEKLVSITDSVKLEIQNNPTKYHPVFGSEKIVCTYAIPEHAINELKQDSVKAILNLKGFKRGAIKVLPEIKGLPSYSQIVKLDSVRITLPR